MNKTKKLTALLCLFSLSVSLCACGSEKKSEKKQVAKSTETPAPTEAPAATEKPVKITEFTTFVSKTKTKKKFKKPSISTEKAKSEKSLKSWKNSAVKKAIVKFVKEATDKKSKNYIPEEDRIVVSDIDGTLIAEKKKKVNNDDMTTLTPSQALDTLIDMQDDYFDEEKKITYSGMLYKPMLEMYEYLQANGFSFYFVSGNCTNLTYAWANYYFGADYAHSIGSDLILDSKEDEDGKFTMGATGKYDGCWEANKAYRIFNQIGKCPVIAFGNSDGDFEMLQWITQNPDYNSLSVMINHDDEREYVYSVDTISKACEDFGFLDAKISENFKKIYMK